MRPAHRLPFALGAVVAVALFAACSSSQPGWTYAPAPSASAAASGAAGSGAPASGATGSGAPASGPAESAGGGGQVVDISAQGIQFEQAQVNAPASQPFQIRFDNKDVGVPHDVAIKDPNGQVVFTGQTFNGPDAKTYDVPALPAGHYQFFCTVHSNMVGSLDVK